jgi:hypothetical protein
MYIVEFITRSGKVCEKFRSYERALHRISQVKDEDLIGIPFIYKELPDGSQRLVREDGKPLQWHRLPDEELIFDEPLPLADLPDAGGNEPRIREASTGASAADLRNRGSGPGAGVTGADGDGSKPSS